MLKNGSLISRLFGIRGFVRRLNILDGRALELEIRADDLEGRLQDVTEALAFTETVQGDDSEACEMLAKIDLALPGLFWQRQKPLDMRVTMLRENRDQWEEKARRWKSFCNESRGTVALLETENATLQARVAELEAAEKQRKLAGLDELTRMSEDMGGYQEIGDEKFSPVVRGPQLDIFQPTTEPKAVTQC